MLAATTGCVTPVSPALSLSTEPVTVSAVMPEMVATTDTTLAASHEFPPPSRPIHQVAYQEPTPAEPSGAVSPASPLTFPPLDPPAASGESLPIGATPVAEQALTLAAIESLAERNNPSLTEAAAIVQKARGAYGQLGRPANPTIGYAGDEIGDDGTYGQQGVYVSQTIVLGGKLAAGQRVAGQEVQSLLWQAEAQRFRVRNDVRRLYYETLGAQERLRLTRELEQIAQQGVENAQVLKEALQAAQPDVLQAEIQQQEVHILVNRAEYQYHAAWRQLASVIGLPEMQASPLADTLHIAQPERDRDTARMQLESQSPELNQAAAEVQRALARIEREKLQPIPNLQIQAGVMQMASSDNTAASLQVGLPIPLFNRNDGNISRAVADYQRACAAVQRLKLNLESRLASTYAQYQDAQNRVRLYHDQIVPREQQTLDLIQSAYPEQFDFLRLLTARRSYFQARLNALDALVDLRKAEVALDGLLISGSLDTVPDTSIDDGLRDSALSGQ